jgi:flagellar protein FliO/FliZ
MLWYFAQLALLLPLLALLIWGSLKLTRMAQDRLGRPHSDARAVRLVETIFLGPGMRLAVIEFRGREILLGCTRQGLTRLSEVASNADDGTQR